MPAPALSERPVGKKKTEPIPPSGRIELQAPPSWVEELDRIAEAVGLSRSAYIRQACNIKMAEDRRIHGIKSNDD